MSPILDDAERIASDNSMTNVEDANRNPNATKQHSPGCSSSQSLEIEYEDEERFPHLKNKKLGKPYKFSSFSYRWRSFRDDHISNIRAGRAWNVRRTTKGAGDDDRTLSSDDSSDDSYRRYNEDSEDSNSEEYQPFGFFLCKENTHVLDIQQSLPTSLDADLDVLAKNPCNEYARRQFEVWRAAAIEGPGGLKTTVFVVALTMLSCSVGLILVKFHQNFWTPGAAVACCHMVMASLLILLLESRSNLTGKGILRDLVTCGCSGKSVEDDLTDNFYHATILPMDAYRECGDQHHYSLEGDRVAKPRHDVVKNIRFFRYLHGRGVLSVFAGSMAFATVPGHLSDYLGVALAICLPGVALMLVGLLEILAGVYAIFRWTLLESSIAGDDHHLLKKFESAGRSLSDKSENKSNRVTGLNQNGFSVLVTMLGLDLDETEVIPAVFALEVRPKDPNAMSFEEFHKWWRGHPVLGHNGRTKSQGTSSNKDKNSLAKPPSSCQGSVV